MKHALVGRDGKERAEQIETVPGKKRKRKMRRKVAVVQTSQ